MATPLKLVEVKFIIKLLLQGRAVFRNFPWGQTFKRVPKVYPKNVLLMFLKGIKHIIII